MSLAGPGAAYGVGIGRDRDQVGDDFSERSIGIQLM